MQGSSIEYSLVSLSFVEGAKKTPSTWFSISPCDMRLFMTVGIAALLSGESVPFVRLAGPRPRMPFIFGILIPTDEFIPPIDWLVMTRLGARVT